MIHTVYTMWYTLFMIYNSHISGYIIHTFQVIWFTQFTLCDPHIAYWNSFLFDREYWDCTAIFLHLLGSPLLDLLMEIGGNNHDPCIFIIPHWHLGPQPAHAKRPIFCSFFHVLPISFISATNSPLDLFLGLPKLLLLCRFPLNNCLVIHLTSRCMPYPSSACVPKLCNGCFVIPVKMDFAN